MEKEEIGRKSVNRKAWETGRQESLHPEAEEATGKAETELEAATLQQNRPSLLHHNLITNKTSERPLSAGDKAEGEARSGSGRHVVLFFSEHCLAMQQNGYYHHSKVITVVISGQRALLLHLSLHRLKKARH